MAILVLVISLCAVQYHQYQYDRRYYRWLPVLIFAFAFLVLPPIKPIPTLTRYILLRAQYNTAIAVHVQNPVLSTVICDTPASAATVKNMVQYLHGISTHPPSRRHTTALFLSRCRRTYRTHRHSVTISRGQNAL